MEEVAEGAPPWVWIEHTALERLRLLRDLAAWVGWLEQAYDPSANDLSREGAASSVNPRETGTARVDLARKGGGRKSRQKPLTAEP